MSPQKGNVTHIEETEHNNKKGQDLPAVSRRQSVFRSSPVRVYKMFTFSRINYMCMIMSSFF